MNSVRGIKWPVSLMRYVQGAGTDSFGSVDERGNAETGRLDLLCCRPVMPVSTYRDLTELVARIAAANPQYQLFFRGQAEQYSLGPLEVHSLCPSLWRGLDVAGKEYAKSLASRARMLFRAGEVLLNVYAAYDHKEAEAEELLHRNPLVRWAVLQHYELCGTLCGTPMLDLTQSLHVASSFALQDPASCEGYLYILGMPYQREMFSVDSQTGITCVSLLGAMPSNALRPYVQSGYLAADNDWWRLYALNDEPVHSTYHVNFANRMIACVRIGGDRFWDETSGGVLNKEALYPTNDAFQDFVTDSGLKDKIADALA